MKSHLYKNYHLLRVRVRVKVRARMMVIVMVRVKMRTKVRVRLSVRILWTSKSNQIYTHISRDDSPSNINSRIVTRKISLISTAVLFSLLWVFATLRFAIFSLSSIFAETFFRYYNFRAIFFAENVFRYFFFRAIDTISLYVYDQEEQCVSYHTLPFIFSHSWSINMIYRKM